MNEWIVKNRLEMEKVYRNDNDLWKAGNRKWNKRNNTSKFLQTARTEEKEKLVVNGVTKRICVVVKEILMEKGLNKEVLPWYNWSNEGS